LAATRLGIYNRTLAIIGERSLASLTEEREPRRLLDDVWSGDGIRYALEQAQWKFALRASRIDYNPAIEPAFGYHHAFDKPSDWVVTSGVCSDEYYRIPLMQYFDEVGYWWSDLDKIYVRYVSDDVLYGMDLGKWPATFTEYVSQLFAYRISGKLSAARERREEIQSTANPRRGSLPEALLTAKNKDAMAVSTEFAAQGNWSRARRGRGSSTLRDGGNRNSLLG
jgi:hypothetical protein